MASRPQAAASPGDRSSTADAGAQPWQRAVWLITAAIFAASFSMAFWQPFIPLYMKELGGGDDAQALGWATVAFTGQGIARLVTGPFWGVIADRYGRKRMFLRALFSASFIILIAAVATEPWHVAVAWALQGALSGFNPAGVALISVLVPRERLTSSLGSVQAGNYAGFSIGPVIGALLAEAFGIRGAVFAASVLPMLTGVAVVFLVTRDHVGPTLRAAATATPPTRRERLRGSLAGLSFQFALGLLLYFILHTSSGLVRVSLPFAVDRFPHPGSVNAFAGWTFAAGNLGAAIGGVWIARLLRVPGRMRVLLGGVLALSGLATIALGVAGHYAVFIAAFAVTGLAQGAMLPPTNTIIASAVPVERRGTAFGWAGSFQALAFIAGPLGAALFARVSLELGYLVLGVTILAVAALMLVKLREPAATS